MAFRETFAALSLVNTVTNAWPGAPGGWNAMRSRYQPSENVTTTEAARSQSFTFLDILRFIAASPEFAPWWLGPSPGVRARSGTVSVLATRAQFAYTEPPGDAPDTW